MTILSMDPGRKNFAWALRKGGEVVDVGWIRPIAHVTDDAAFVNDCIELLAQEPDFVVLERFLVRGGGQSMLAESLNQMIGRLVILTRVYAGVELVQITPAQWKNWWTKSIKKDWHKEYSKVKSVHQRDACGMAHYLDEYWIAKNI